MKPPSASQLVTIAAACATSSSPAPPDSSHSPSLSSTLHLPGGSKYPASAATQARVIHVENGEYGLPNDWGKSFAMSSVLNIRGGASSDDKHKQNARETARSPEKKTELSS